MDIKDVLKSDDTFRYSLLDRMKSDCKYFLGNGNHNTKYLWAKNIDDQIAYMKAIWNSFPEDGKPEWLSMEEIENFERQMLGMTAVIEEKGGVLNVCGVASIQIDNEQMAIDEIKLVLRSKGLMDIKVEVTSVSEIDDLEDDWSTFHASRSKSAEVRHINFVPHHSTAHSEKQFVCSFSGKISHDKLPDLQIATYVEEVKTDLPSLESLIDASAKQASSMTRGELCLPTREQR